MITSIDLSIEMLAFLSYHLMFFFFILAFSPNGFSILVSKLKVAKYCTFKTFILCKTFQVVVWRPLNELRETCFVTFIINFNNILSEISWRSKVMGPILKGNAHIITCCSCRDISPYEISTHSAAGVFISSQITFKTFLSSSENHPWFSEVLSTTIYANILNVCTSRYPCLLTDRFNNVC